MKVEFTISGEPKPKLRTRAFVNKYSGKVVQWTPNQTAVYENLIKYTYQKEVGHKFEGAISIECFFHMPIPKSISKKDRDLIDNFKLHPTKKPDIDNLLKAVCDGLNGVAFDDDKQIVHIHGYKMYSDNPRTSVSIHEPAVVE